MKPEAMAAASKSGGSTVAFSWEQEPGVSKQSHSESSEANKHAASGVPRSRRTPARAKKQVTAAAHPHRLRVPPPPGGPGAPAASPPPGRSRRVKPAEDPFLAAYLACTEGGASDDGGRGYGGAQKLLGLGLGMRGLGLSCKSSYGAVEECVVRLAKIRGLDED